jgi:hypothetical protein
VTGVPLVPPRTTKSDGAPRRVGIEIEFTGPDCRAAADLAARLYGGMLEERSPQCFELRGTTLGGDIAVELDVAAAHPERKVPLQELGEPVEKIVRSALLALGRLVMPLEVGFPPLPIGQLPEVDRLVAALREQGAEGTRSGLLRAFGLHLNPEAAALDAGYLAQHLKAFALLAPWLRAEIDVDLSRRVSPFIQPYPEAYVRRLADPDYRPSLDWLIDDYLDANPSRDRELDMLPIFALLAPEKVAGRARESKIRPRPAFHYRLPDSRIDEPDWGVVLDWNRWVLVERLADDPERLAAMGRAYLERPPGGSVSAWVREARRWIGP